MSPAAISAGEGWWERTIRVARHTQAIGAILADEHPSDAVGALFNRYAELPDDGERTAFALAMIAELVVARAVAEA